jgi:hypothetical protein
MASGYTATLPADVLLDTGIVYVGATLWGATVGGVKFTPTRELRSIPFDGARSSPVGLDRVVKYGATLSATFLEFGPTQIPFITAGAAPTGGPLPTPIVYMPSKAGALLVNSAYLTDVYLVFQRANGGAARIWFRRARVATYSLEGHENAEALVALEIDAHEAVGFGGTDTDDAPYIIQLSTTNNFPSSATILRYTPGDSLTGQSFTRASSATYMDVNGVMQTAASGVLRDAHYIGGIRHTLIEPTRTNSMWYSMQPNQAGGWGAAPENLTRTATGVANIDGSSTAVTFTDNSAASARHVIYPQFTSPTVGTTYVIFKRVNWDWVWITKNSLVTFFDLNNVVVGTTNHPAAGIQNLGNGWILCWVYGTTGTSQDEIGIAAGNGTQAYTGSGAKSVTIGGAQMENGLGPTSMIVTANASGTRAADLLKWALNPFMQALTMYIDTTELDFVRNLVNGTYLTAWYDEADANPLLSIQALSATPSLQAQWYNSGAVLSNGSLASPAAFGRQEARAILDATGTIQIGTANAGGAETLGTVSAANGLPANWGTSPNLRLEIGAYRKVAVLQGNADLPSLRLA